VIGGIKIECKEKAIFTKYGIEIIGSEYNLGSSVSDISSIDDGQELDGSLMVRDFKLKISDDK